MKIYKVEVKQITITSIAVVADSQSEAIHAALSGNGHIVESHIDQPEIKSIKAVDHE